MTLRCLFVDFDSFFASVEQHDDSRLLGRPVAVVPVMSASTCCIAASKEAKRDFGIKTGTGVAEALERCPDIALVLARPSRYIELHHAFMQVIKTCIPHEQAASIDEVPCFLMGRERQRENAVAIARAIKRGLVDAGIGPSMTCSIGIAPNRFLAKTASDMDKPDGLTVLEERDLPDALFGLELRDFCGVGPSMERRLRAAGIHTSEQLCRAGRGQLRRVWGGIEGERFWLQLHGHPLPERKSETASIGHSHVLGPELRNFAGMRSVLFKLLAKAAMRMRAGGFRASGLAIRVRFLGTDQRFERDLRFAPLDDTPALLALLGEQLAAIERARSRGRWQERRHPPLSVAVTLVELESAEAVSGELIPGRGRDRAVSRLLDRVNDRFGNNALFLGGMQEAIALNAAPMRIPFQHVPDTRLEHDVADRAEAGDFHDDLMHLRLNQAKVMAEATHREQQHMRERGRKKRHQPVGVGGWGRRGDEHHDGSETAVLPLF
jgi:DNA polymerase-4